MNQVLEQRAEENIDPPLFDATAENVKSILQPADSKLKNGLEAEEHYKHLDNYIMMMENVVPDELCDQIIKEYAPTSYWTPRGIGWDPGAPNVDKNIRDVDGIVISHSEVIAGNLEYRKQLDTSMFNCVSNAMREYQVRHPLVAIQQDSGYDLLRYGVNQHYIQHVDSYKGSDRAVSCSIALNDDYDGGEFTFFSHRFKYKLKKGSALLFPSNFMYPHSVMPIRRGVRYAIITWLA